VVSCPVKTPIPEIDTLFRRVRCFLSTLGIVKTELLDSLQGKDNRHLKNYFLNPSLLNEQKSYLLLRSYPKIIIFFKRILQN
jgi:hypothetical protein